MHSFSLEIRLYQKKISCFGMTLPANAHGKIEPNRLWL